MKMLIIIKRDGKYFFASAILILFASLAVFLAIVQLINPAHIQTAGGVMEDEIAGLEKDNSKLKEVLKNIVPKENKLIYEDEYRNRYINAGSVALPSIQSCPLTDVLKKGTAKNFKVLTDYPQDLRPIYDPGWRGFYFRGWLYLPYKNIDARHRMFIFPFGLSSIFDFTGSLGLEKEPAIDYHKNINFLIYGFKVDSIKEFGHQVALVGKPLRTGVQVVSIVQDELLSEDEDTEDFIFQLSTPKGYEIDFDYGNIIRYKYLKQKIEENTVKPSALAASKQNNILEDMINENFSLKKELSYFIPLEDKAITQEKGKPIPPEFPYDAPDISTIRLKSRNIKFAVNYQNSLLKRPVYDPLWLKNYKSRWCYIPAQVCSNRQKIFMIPKDIEEQPDFFGITSFYEKYIPIKQNEIGFLIYGFNVNKASIYNDQLLLTGAPSRTGAQVITLSISSIQTDRDYLIRLVTPDGQEVDYTIMYN